MKKDKVVIFDTLLGGAKVHINFDANEYIANEYEIVLVNPDTKAVNSLPPEFWKYENGKIVAVTDELEVSKRLLNLKTLPFIQKAVRQHGVDLSQTIDAISRIKHIEKSINGLMVTQKVYFIAILLILIGDLLWLIFLA